MTRYDTNYFHIQPQFPYIVASPSTRTSNPTTKRVRSGSMSKKKTAHKSPAIAPDSAPANEQADLDSRYGAIGIPAVAAALPYRGAVKNPVYASSADEL